MAAQTARQWRQRGGAMIQWWRWQPAQRAAQRGDPPSSPLLLFPVSAFSDLTLPSLVPLFPFPFSFSFLVRSEAFFPSFLSFFLSFFLFPTAAAMLCVCALLKEKGVARGFFWG
ncbi:hypothetical protein S245_060366 [Arachis hypogaea]